MLAQEEAADLLDECERIITRYRSETPLGNQPHMIADKADRLLAKLREQEKADETEEAADLLDECERALINVTVHLIAAVSLLEGGGKKAAPSDKMFKQMVLDYKKSIEAGRSTLAKLRANDS